MGERWHVRPFLPYDQSHLGHDKKMKFFLKKQCFYVFLGPWPSAPCVGLRPLGPLNFIVTVSRNRLVWPGWSIKILQENVVIFKNTTQIINRRIFRVLFIQGTFSTKPFVNSGSGIVASINTTNIKVCMFRGLLRDLIKISNWDILRACAIEKLHKCYK